jgi:hypothetical protein
MEETGQKTMTWMEATERHLEQKMAWQQSMTKNQQEM